jgi:hypothetical protein
LAAIRPAGWLRTQGWEADLSVVSLGSAMNETKKPPKLEGMEDRLERQLNRVTDWVKYEEAKNAALITLDGVGAGMILQWLSVSRQHAAVTPWLTGSLVLLLISLLISLSSFYPVTKGKNILYFYDLAERKPVGYLKDLCDAVKDDNIQLAYAQEIVTNSHIAVLKLRIFKAAFMFGFLGFIVTAVAVVIHNFPQLKLSG